MSVACGQSGPHAGMRQHARFLAGHRQAWERKPALREVYRNFHREIARRIDPAVAGPTLELGSGMGWLKETIPQCITSDFFDHDWLDRRENAYALSARDESIAHLVLFDVWHHLRHPGKALSEFQRVLAPGGLVLLFEPAMSWLGRFVYHFLHHEPTALREPIAWHPEEPFDPWRDDYYAAQGNASRLFWWGEAAGWLDGWILREVTPISSLAYLATGGFSGPELLPHGLARCLRPLEWAAGLVPRITATRLLIVLEKTRAR